MGSGGGRGKVVVMVVVGVVVLGRERDRVRSIGVVTMEIGSVVEMGKEMGVVI